MRVNGKQYRTIWEKYGDSSAVCIIDQRRLPFDFVIEELRTLDDFLTAISAMHVRGAPLIGAAAAYALYIALLNDTEDQFKMAFAKAASLLRQTRPTAVNLNWAIDRQLDAIQYCNSRAEALERLLANARKIADDDARNCELIGEHGLVIIKEILHKKIDTISKKSKVVFNILTHCNAGWLATVDWGTALAPIYKAARAGIDVHVWVDETRPRNQGSKLTAWELAQENIPNTIIVDNAGGHLMQHGLVDMVIVGADRIASNGDVANKIGTYLKAIAAYDNNVPFYVAAPLSSIDMSLSDGLKIIIEEREQDEILFIDGMSDCGMKNVRIAPHESSARNYAFDVTPSRLVTGLITEKGVCKADSEKIKCLFNTID
jgi:methylthioribose-1-phosphate isomerase